MKNLWKIVVVLLLVGSIGAVIALKKAEQEDKTVIVEPVISASVVKAEKAAPKDLPEKKVEPKQVVETAESAAAEPVAEVAKLPRLIELGSDRCIPCKQMTPILAELTAEYAGKLKVEFYDVWKNQQYGQQFKIRVIPTQIFIGSDGKELFRHEGFYPKQDILNKWKQLGYDFNKAD